MGAVTGVVSGLMKMLGYDERRLGRMAVNMIMYVGELTANSIVDGDNGLETEIPQYRSYSDSGDILSFIKVSQPNPPCLSYYKAR